MESWDDVLNKVIYIKARLYGTTAASTLNINGLGAKYLYFPNMDDYTLTTTPYSMVWVRTGGVYGVVWDGACLQVVNPLVCGGGTNYKGVVQLTTSTPSTSAALAPTASALNEVRASIPTTASGSFTPIMGGTSGTGYYRKIGNVVTIAASITFSSAISTANNITGLPYDSIACNQAISTSKG